MVNLTYKNWWFSTKFSVAHQNEYLKPKSILKKQLLFLFIVYGFITQVAVGQKTTIPVAKYIKQLDSVHRKEPPKAFTALEEYLNKKGVKSFTVTELDEIYYALAKYSSRSFDFENSKRYARKGIQVLDENNIVKGKSGYYNLLGGVVYFDNKLDSAAYYFTQSLDALKEEGATEKIPFVTNNIANIYSEQNNAEKALPYFLEAYTLLSNETENRNTGLLGPVTGNLAFTYYQLDSLKPAKKYANEALLLGKKYDHLQGAAVAYNVKAFLARGENKLDSAKYFLKQAYDAAIKENNNYQIAFTATNLSELLSKNEPSEAVKFGEIAYKVNTQGKKGNMLYKNIRALSNAYFNVGDFEKAAIFQQQYIAYKDSLFDADYNEKTIDVLEKYQATQKELTINQQEAEITKKENQQRILTIVLIALGVLSLLALLFFRQRQKTQKQKIITLESERENIALRSLMTGEEKERSRIAKELHDGLGGILAAAKMHASTNKDPEKVVSLLNTASQESRRISHNLLPESLLKKGLDVALRDFINSINESGLLKADYQSINVAENLPQHLQLSVYRIVQELINNIIKHAGATETLVQLQQQENKKLILTVEDNGKGFSQDKATKGIGLQNIESRLSLLKGTLEIDSQAKLGTSVYIELELEK